jgi:hypothetical protein
MVRAQDVLKRLLHGGIDHFGKLRLRGRPFRCLKSENTHQAIMIGLIQLDLRLQVHCAGEGCAGRLLFGSQRIGHTMANGWSPKKRKELNLVLALTRALSEDGNSG